ncbi:MAG TPA: hypothetical protein VJL58_10180 [Pyrinomonadaceae bacterium]|nr:hypothetical protein [Pyrinomonadaceae bacterium]
MEWWHWLLLIGIVAAIVFMVLRWRGKKKEKQAEVEKKQAAIDRKIALYNTLTDRHGPVAGRTPAVASRPGVWNSVYEEGIFQGFLKINTEGAKYNWGPAHTPILKPEDFAIRILPRVGTFDGVPAFAEYFEEGNPYDESDFDQERGKPGGYVLAVESLDLEKYPNWEIGPARNNTFNLVETDDVNQVRDFVYNALEHYYTYAVDAALGRSFRDHVRTMWNPVPSSHPFLAEAHVEWVDFVANHPELVGIPIGT